VSRNKGRDKRSAPSKDRETEVEQSVHSRHHPELAGFARSLEALDQGADDRVAAHAGNGGEVEAGAQLRTSFTGEEAGLLLP